MIELDPNRSFAVQKLEREVRDLEREVQDAEEEFRELERRLQAAYTQLDVLRKKENK